MVDPYLIPGTQTLRNKPGLTNPDELQDYETKAALLRQHRLFRFPLDGKFDTRHLCAIHRSIFQDVYDWAGQLRTVNISKPGAAFAFAFILPQALEQFSARLAGERHLDGLPPEAFTARLAYHFGELNAIHPFREGNGRTQREFFRLLALRRGYALQWNLATRDEMLHASQRSFRGDYAAMTALLNQAIRPATAVEAQVQWRTLPTA